MIRALVFWFVWLAFGVMLLAAACRTCTDLVAVGSLDVHVAELPWTIAVGEHGVSVSHAIY
jgi:hypothetical protein